MLVQEVICGVLKKSTRVLVTNQMQVLAKADIIVVLEGGRIVAKGTLAQLYERGVQLPDHLDQHHSGMLHIHGRLVMLHSRICGKTSRPC